MDRGPWSVEVYRGVFLRSDDASHDAFLAVHGNFGNKDERVHYALELADLLNQAIKDQERAG